MNPDFIKPVPKYLLAKIQRLDKKHCPERKGTVRFYSYLTKIKGELVKITTAVKNHKKNWYCKQVAAHGVKSDKCYVKDMEYLYYGMGFRVGWFAEGLQNHKKWFEDGKWYDADSKYYNPLTVMINPEYVGKFPEYKYSAYQHFQGWCIIQYLKLYMQYPQTEYLLKLGLFKIHDSITVLKRIAKDKGFCKWLIINKDEIASEYCYISAIMQAYKTGKPIRQIQAFLECKKKLDSDSAFEPLKKLFGKDLDKFFSYLEIQDSNPRSYLDYLKACNYLGLDMSRKKNIFPHNFKHWHDIRIDQYHAAKALADEKKRVEVYAQFKAVAEKYMALQKIPKTGFAVIIATSPAELNREGEILNHCVGKMNYDCRMTREETLIFFVRNIHNPDVPFVTIEYSPQLKKSCNATDTEMLSPTMRYYNMSTKFGSPMPTEQLKN